MARELEGIGIYCPTYKRNVGSVTTHKIIANAVYVVAEAEAANYNGVNKIICPDKIQGNLCRVRNWILDNAQEENILLLDDDFLGLSWFEKNRSIKMDQEWIAEFIEAGFRIAAEAGAVFWGVNSTGSADKGAYREYTPFSLSAYIGGPFQAHLKGNECRYDERLPLKEDYDFTLQVLNKYRKVFRFNMVFLAAKQHTNIGGCASYRTIEFEKEQFALLVKKWGRKIIKTDGGNSKTYRKKGRGYDLNPVLQIPIKGV